MRKYLYLPLIAITVLCMGLAALNCGDNEDPKECETNEICIEKHGAGWWCDRTVWECKPCIPICEGKCCGGDGCGGTCTDNCTAPEFCNTQTCGCVSGCQDDGDCTTTQCCINNNCTEMSCGTLECGNDPVCSKSCGTCTAPETCNNGTCVGPCADDTDCTATQCCINNLCTEMSCGTMECDDDPVCGKSCGTCTAPETCQNGQCVGVNPGNLGDPCAFGDVNATEGGCNAGLECLGIAADGNTGTCPGGAATECTDLHEDWNRDCVNGNCGASFCSQPCDAQGNCPQFFIPLDVGNPPECMCVPGGGVGQPGDPCPWDTVNVSYPECAGGACLGNDDIGSCPGGADAECTGVAGSWNPNCVGGVCGFSFCADECVGGACDAGFNPGDVSGTCYCIPDEDGTSLEGEPCPFGDMHNSSDFCVSGLTCLGNDNTGTCPGGTAAECGIPDVQNPDCVAGVCGFSHCTARCDAAGNCGAGYVPEDVGTPPVCYCVPGEPGTAQLGDPCPFGAVNDTAESCAPGLSCLGNPDDGTSGTCPGGNPTECTDIPANHNPDCVGTNCGASFCSEPCDAQRNCPAGFVGQDVGTPPVCYCVPS